MLLDSNILIQAGQRPEPVISELLAGGSCVTASVVQIEVYGFKGLQPEERASLDVIFGHLRVLALTDAVVQRAITLRQQRKMGLGDAIVAATALVHGGPLVTRNTQDFKPIAGLRLVDPFVSVS